MTGNWSILGSENRELQQRLKSLAVFPTHLSCLKSRKEFFSTNDGDVAFAETSSAVVMAGEPVVRPSGCLEGLIDSLFAFAESKNKIVCGYYVSENFHHPRLQKLLIGTSSLLSLKDYQLSGYAKKDVRRALNHGRRASLEFIEFNSADRQRYRGQIQKLYDQWLKTRRGPEIGFLLSPPDSHEPQTIGAREVAVFENNELAAYVSIWPYKSGGGLGFYLDDMIQSPRLHRFALDYLISRLIFKLKAESIDELSLGFNAFAQVQPKTLFQALLWTIGQLQWPYRNNGLRSYKRKFNGREVPRYLVYDRDRNLLSQIYSMISITYPAVSELGPGLWLRLLSLQD